MLDLKPLIKDKRCKKYREGQQINADSSVRAIYFLVDGSVSAINGGSRSYIKPMEAFGGHEFFNGGETAYTAEADSSVYVITEASFRKAVRKHPALLYEILKGAYCRPDAEEAAEDAEQERSAAEPKPEPIALEEFEQAAESELKPIAIAEPVPTANEEPVPTAAPEPGPADVRSPGCNAAGSLRNDDKSETRAYAGIYPEGHVSYPGVVHPEYEKLLYKKNYKCPNCGIEFRDYKIFKSKLSYSKPVRYDMRSCFNGFQMEWYEIVTCPNCLFSMFHNYFTEPRFLRKEKLNEALAEAQGMAVIDFIAQRDIDYVFTAHYLALVCAGGYTSQRRHIQAKIWANLSWLYEDVGDEGMARFAAGECASAYVELLEESSLSPAQEQAVNLTIAGMMFRAGRRENIKKYLFTAKTSKAGKRVYANLASDLMETIRAEM